MTSRNVLFQDEVSKHQAARVQFGGRHLNVIVQKRVLG